MPRIAVFLAVFLLTLFFTVSTYFLVKELSDYRVTIVPLISSFLLGVLIIISQISDENEEKKLRERR